MSEIMFDPIAHIQGFLIIVDGKGGNSCSAFQNFNELVKIWGFRKTNRPGTALAHIGFDFSLSRIGDAFAPELSGLYSHYPNRLLVTAALKYALPPNAFATTQNPELTIAGIPVFICNEDKK